MPRRFARYLWVMTWSRGGKLKIKTVRNEKSFSIKIFSSQFIETNGCLRRKIRFRCDVRCFSCTRACCSTNFILTSRDLCPIFGAIFHSVRITRTPFSVYVKRGSILTYRMRGGRYIHSVITYLRFPSTIQPLRPAPSNRPVTAASRVAFHKCYITGCYQTVTCLMIQMKTKRRDFKCFTPGMLNSCSSLHNIGDVEDVISKKIQFTFDY